MNWTVLKIVMEEKVSAIGVEPTKLTALMRDADLSHQQKVEMLESWRDDKEALMRAAEEGMRGEVRLDLLKKIEDALSYLQEMPSG